MDHKQVPL